MNKNLLYKLLAIVMLASLVLTACGSGNGTETPEATAETVTLVQMPTMTKNENQGTYGNYVFTAENLTTVIGKSYAEKDIIGLAIDMQEYTVEADIVTPASAYVEWSVWLAINAVNDGQTTKKLECFTTNGTKQLDREHYNQVGVYDVTTQVSVFCPLGGGKTLWVYFNLIVEDKNYQRLLTGTPAENGTVATSSNNQTFTPSASLTPSLTPTLGTVTVTPTPGFATITPTATKTRFPTMTSTYTATTIPTGTTVPVTTQTMTCSNRDQDVEYTVTGPIAGTLTCQDNLTRQDTPVKTLVIPGAHGNMNITLDRVGGPNAMYAALITFIPGIYGTAQWTMTGTSISEGHAEVSTNGNTLIRVQDGEVVSLDLSTDDFTVTAEAWLK